MLKRKQKSGMLFLTIIMLLASVMVRPQVGIAQVDPEEKRMVLGSGDFQIEVNAGGQVPFYHFNISDTAFFLKFQQIVQYNDTNGNQIYDAGELVGGQSSTLQLPSVQWVFTSESTDSTIDFNFTSSKINNPIFEDLQIGLNNHYTTGDLAVKFDIIISGWPFVEEATGLSLEFELTWSQESEEENTFSKESNETGIYLYNQTEDLVAFFDMTSEIEITIGDVVTTALAILNDTASEHASKLNVYINYPIQFDKLVHDPEFGTSKVAIIPLTNPTAIVLWLEENVKAGFLGLTAIATLFLAVLVVFTRTKKYG